MSCRARTAIAVYFTVPAVNRFHPKVLRSDCRAHLLSTFVTVGLGRCSGPSWMVPSAPAGHSSTAAGVQFHDLSTPSARPLVHLDSHPRAIDRDRPFTCALALQGMIGLPRIGEGLCDVVPSTGHRVDLRAEVVDPGRHVLIGLRVVAMDADPFKGLTGKRVFASSMKKRPPIDGRTSSVPVSSPLPSGPASYRRVKVRRRPSQRAAGAPRRVATVRQTARDRMVLWQAPAPARARRAR